MKVAINTIFGGFHLSNKAAQYMAQSGNAEAIEYLQSEFKNQWPDFLIIRETKRNDPALVEAIETLGAEANGKCSKLKIVTVPDDVEWEIVDYDGLEHIAEKHRTWD